MNMCRPGRSQFGFLLGHITASMYIFLRTGTSLLLLSLTPPSRLAEQKEVEYAPGVVGCVDVGLWLDEWEKALQYMDSGP